MRDRSLGYRALYALALLLAVVALPVSAVRAATPGVSPRYQELGAWNHVDVVYRYGTDETITFASDDTWARAVREDFVNGGAFGLRCIYPNLSGDPTLDCQDDPSQGPVSRPGWIACAYIQRYSGYWQELTDYSNVGVGQSLIAIRDDNSTSATGADCASIYQWASDQDAMNGFPAPVTEVLGGGGGGGAGGSVTVLPPPHKAQHPSHHAGGKKQCKPHKHCQ